jgi:hypothetical protein
LNYTKIVPWYDRDTLPKSKKYPDKPWEWGDFGLSFNPSITPDFIEKNIEKPWHWGKLGLSCLLAKMCGKLKINQYQAQQKNDENI